MAHSKIHGHLPDSGAPSCAYPGCREVFSDGIVVTAINPQSDGIQYVHKTYCCELHAALALLRVTQADLASVVGDDAGEMILNMVKKSARGELVLAESERLSIVWRNPKRRLLKQV